LTDIAFYHLQTAPLERALPALLEKVLSAEKRAVVKLGSVERVEALNDVLWTYNNASFLPHGSAKDGNADKHPIWLTQNDENPNGSDVLILADGATSEDVAGYDRCLEMFDGTDDTAVTAARARWTEYKAAGHIVTYWQQTDQGGWEAKA
jgi:DNA polymerase-3 subunit chi